MEKKENLWCRNCREVVPHELIEIRPCPQIYSGLRGIFEQKKEPIYACIICRCERGIEERKVTL